MKKASDPSEARIELERELRAAGTAEGAAGAARFFKTGPGEYGQGDVFLGVSTPVLRRLVKRYSAMDLDEIATLLRSVEHEFRSAALAILVLRHKTAAAAERKEILAFYLGNTAYINNWDLVDLSCGEIVGSELKAGRRGVLDRLVRSESMWERRIAMVSTRALVRDGELADALRIAEALLDDTHDLIHKAVGWVLREVGDADREVLLKFLREHYPRVRRTALRYAIEHFSAEDRGRILKGNIAI